MVLGPHDDAKEAIRQRIDIVELVREQIDLRPQGRNLVGLCPWHQDSRPSLQVNPERQSWKCWVCDLGGDIFSYVMQREGVEFREALEILADKAGVELRRSNARPAAAGSPQDKATLYRAMKWAADQFHRCLQEASSSESARAYLAERQITDDSIQRFQIGFAPQSWQWLCDAAQGEFSPEVLEAVGLVAKSAKSGKWYDRFRGRVVFPICDTQQRPIAIGGRVLPEFADDKSAKYINSPETRLFSKSDQLYGLDLARDAVRRERSVVVMEGYTDVVIAHQTGLNQSVAVLGTALGPRHINVLQRYGDRITLVLDGDDAGQRRANDILQLFIANQVDLRIVTLPDGMDPADFLLRHGPEALQQLIVDAPDALAHKYQLETAGIDLVNDTHRANRALENMLELLARGQATTPKFRAKDDGATRLREQQVLARLARDFRISDHDLRERIDEYRRNMQRRTQARSPVDDNDGGRARDVEHAPYAAEPLSGSVVESRRDKVHEAHGNDTLGSTSLPALQPIERDLIELLLQHPVAVPRVLEEITADQLLTVTAQGIYRHLKQLLDDRIDPSFENLLLRIENPQVKSLLVELDEQGAAKITDGELALNDLIATFHRKKIEQQLLRDQTELENNNVGESKQVEMLAALVRKRQELVD